jgi:acyl-coenzyme A synthetase/AMP-(fatty) acid ligase
MYTSIADRLLGAFDRYDDRVAISEGDNAISYNLLSQRSTRIAAYIKQHNLANACIAIELDNITDHIAAILGVVLSGNWYISITAENRSFLAAANLPIALTIAYAGKSDTTIAFNEILSTAYDADFTAGIDGHQNMCAFFTSGSTAQSKVIIHQHQNILNDTLRQINDNEISLNDKIDLVFSLTFSASLACIYPALLTGAQLCIFDLKAEGLNRLADFWGQQAITFSTLSVSSFHGVCKLHRSLHHLIALRFISISAEPVKDSTISLFKTAFNTSTTLQIAYASTETRTVSEMKVTNTGAPILYPDAIGKPVADKTVHIADEAGNYLAVGATGEIIVESRFI